MTRADSPAARMTEHFILTGGCFDDTRHYDRGQRQDENELFIKLMQEPVKRRCNAS
jgi:hypothetical protein